MIDLPEITRQLSSNAQAIRALVGSISPEQAAWKPDPQTWCMQEVMEHVYNEERVDFRRHLQEMFSSPPRPWNGIRVEWVNPANLRAALDGFLDERAASLAWLQGLPSPNWDASISASFGPDNETLTLKAGEVLTSWLEHDFLHLRQMIELHYAWAEQQAAPYSVQYAGGW